ncbi:hypothetical protein [Type-E symbiont of Plautia stali]|uniref:hypothetical protein n=1 Tax=Type-E symbiont of Plautia stali TaxID=1560357 RepID=UPI00073F3BAD|nr:hypothetical protein [Type-E symbiont of Plautia stali]
MSNHQTVDQFVIELGFSEKVLAGLNRVEKQVMPIATRIEKRLDKVFSANRSQKMEPTFRAIEKRAALAGRNIQRSLSSGFNIRNADSGMFTRFQREGQAAAREVGRSIRDAYRIRGSAIPPLPPLQRPGQPRQQRNPRQVIEDLHQRQLTSGFYGNLTLRDADRAAQYRSRLERLRMESTAAGDIRGFRNGLRSLNYEFAQGQRQASILRSQQRLQALEASNAGNGLSRLTDSATGLLAGFFALNKAMNFLQESITVGGKFQQAHTMGVVAYGDEAENTRMTIKADQTSRAYGLDPLQTREQQAQMRMTMPDSFSNDQISQLFENESVFAHTTGMSPDAVGRLNYAFQQIATSAHLMGQDFLQVVNASPALIRGLQKLHGFTNSSQLKEYYKTVPGSAFVSDSLKVMTPTEQQKQLAQNNIIAAQGRLAGSLQFAKRDFFDSMERPMVRLFATLTESADNLGSTLKPVAVSVGFLADRLSDVAENANSAASNLTGYAVLASKHWDDFYSGLDKSAQLNLTKLSGIFNEWFDTLLVIIAGKLAIAGAGKLGKMAGLGSAGEMMGAAGRTFGIAAAVVMGKELGDLLFDKFIPQFEKFAHDKWGWGGKDGTETTHGGNALKDSPVDRVWTWADNMIDMIKKSPMPNAGGFPSLSGAIASPPALPPKPITFAPLKIEVVSNGKINVTMPDGSMQRVALDVVQQQHEVQMMSAQGLEGSWQGAGQNAGWNPSSLLRSN